MGGAEEEESGEESLMGPITCAWRERESEALAHKDRTLQLSKKFGLCQVLAHTPRLALVEGPKSLEGCTVL